MGKFIFVRLYFPDSVDVLRDRNIGAVGISAGH